MLIVVVAVAVIPFNVLDESYKKKFNIMDSRLIALMSFR